RNRGRWCVRLALPQPFTCRTMATRTMASDGRRAEARQRWVLNGEAFELLLAALDPDRERAAAAYERLRERTIGLLRWWGALHPEELTDETLDRVARKLAEGVPIAAPSFGAYVRGVARLVFYEAGRERVAPLTGREALPPVQPDDVEMAAQCLDHCLASLPAPERQVLLRYYGPGKASTLRQEIAVE